MTKEIKITGDVKNGLEAVAARVAGWTCRAQTDHEPVLPKTPEQIAEQIRGGRSLLAWEGRKLVGHATLYELGTDGENRGWFEVGTLMVPPEDRRKGVGNELCKALASHEPEAYLVPTTKNPAAIKAFLRAGFEEGDFAKVPLNIREGLCYAAPCYREVEALPGRCINEAALGGNCHLLIRRPIQNDK